LLIETTITSARGKQSITVCSPTNATARDKKSFSPSNDRQSQRDALSSTRNHIKKRSVLFNFRGLSNYMTNPIEDKKF
jgi:hypothetical protein